MDILIGSDPEFFIRKGRHIISAHPYPFGDKRRPMKTEHGFIQIDGMAMECNVTPSATPNEFVKNLRGVMADMTTELKKYEPDAEIVIKPSVFIGNTRLGALPLYAAELGCRPDFNAYTGEQNDAPDARSPIRTASGHLHISWTKDKSPRDEGHFADCMRLARQLDFYVGMPSLLWDDDHRRRSMYGQAGAFRPKPYGMEYRVLSNAWTRTDKLAEWVFKAARTATLNLFQEGVYLPKSFGDIAQYSINTNDTAWPKNNPALAEEILQ